MRGSGTPESTSVTVPTGDRDGESRTSRSFVGSSGRRSGGEMSISLLLTASSSNELQGVGPHRVPPTFGSGGHEGPG